MWPVECYMINDALLVSDTWSTPTTYNF